MSCFLNPCGPPDRHGRKCGKMMKRMTSQSTFSSGQRLVIGSLVQSFTLLKLDWPEMAQAVGLPILLTIVRDVGQLWMEVLFLKIPRSSVAVRKQPTGV